MKIDQSAMTKTGNKDRIIFETLTKLKRREYTLKFTRVATCLYCFQLNDWIKPEDFKLDGYYYFEDILNPDEERIIYAISLSGGLKGFLIDTCDVYTDNISPVMMQKLKLNKIKSRKNDLANAGKRKKADKLSNKALAF